MMELSDVVESDLILDLDLAAPTTPPPAP